MPPAATAAAVEELEKANFCFGAKAAWTQPRQLWPYYFCCDDDDDDDDCG